MAKTLKQKAWDEFSRYRRIRRCLETTGLPFVGICVTCNRKFHISALETGHAISGRSNAVLLIEKFTDLQCSYCNRMNHGRPKEFRKVLENRYGTAFIEKWFTRLKSMAKRGVIPSNQINWEARIERYKKKYKKVMRAHGYKTWADMLRESNV